MKKNKMERKLLKEIFNHAERNVIYNALQYSLLKNKQRSNIDSAIEVQAVLNHVTDAFGVDRQKYTKDEVDKIVDDVMERSAKKAAEFFNDKIDEARKSGYETALKDVSAGIIAIAKHDDEAATDSKCQEKSEKREVPVGGGGDEEKPEEKKEE